MCACWIWEIVAWGGRVEGLDIVVKVGLLVFEDTGGVRDGGVWVVDCEVFGGGNLGAGDPGGGV